MKPAARLGALCLALCCLGDARGLWSRPAVLLSRSPWPSAPCVPVRPRSPRPSSPSLAGALRDGRDSAPQPSQGRLRSSSAWPVAGAPCSPNERWRIGLVPLLPERRAILALAGLLIPQGEGPDRSEGCNRSWHFNPEEIKDLLPDMKIYWPDLLHPSPNRSLHLWKHEWEKHGTCAAQLEALNSQKKYFGKSLDLSKELALNSTLQKLGITPSTYYQISDIKDALVSVYGVVPKVQCLPKQGGEEVQLLAQIEVCFSKDLQLQNCMDPGEPAPRGPEARPAASLGLEVCKDGVLFYPALNKTNH
ncbi:hypothetical protein J1605_020628 [Eschrichtius robustus]|uniref:Uncharacterized protein n=1 Tax=Eschrichtius robustus TaxID=9764 RepID=A0AB34HJA3_ESCRO|nr:hypothetical protein J1605_020628 [Eschrichtius robustus]